MSVTSGDGRSMWTDRLDREWHHWIDQAPPSGKLIRLRTCFEQPDNAVTVMSNDVRPEFNIANAVWQMTGVGLESTNG